MCTKGTTVSKIITGNKRKPISTTVRRPATTHPTVKITIQATWYHSDCRAWKETLGERSLYISQITSAPTGPKKPVRRFRNTERWARTDQVFSSFGLVAVAVPLPGPEPPGSDPSGSGSMPWFLCSSDTGVLLSLSSAYLPYEYAVAARRFLVRASLRSLRLLSGAIPAGVGDRWRSGAAR